VELLSRVGRLLKSTSFRERQGTAALASLPSVLPWREHYAVLRAYAENNSLYELLTRAAYEASLWQEPIKGFRNPAFRLIEWYAATLWPGNLPAALPIETENDRIREPIAQVWTWSNWAARKQRAARWLARDGDLFIKIVSRQNAAGQVDRVYFQLLDAACVTEFDCDERGFIQWIRLDVPQLKRENDKAKTVMLTEVWDKSTETFRQWEHEQTADTAIGQLGVPERTEPFSVFGLSFIPVVWSPFRDVGGDRGQAAIMPIIDKIDEANRKAARLGQMLFRSNKNTWALEGIGNDAQGRPLPPPSIGERGGNGTTSGTVTQGDEDFYRLPGNSKLASLVPNLDYDAYLKALQDDMREIENDAPELLYFRITELGELSGRALRFLLGPAIKRTEEARGNAEQALVRANQIALTLGVAAGLFPKEIGTYEEGAFDHGFEEREVVPLSEVEAAEAEKLQAATVAIERDLGISEAAGLRKLGYSEQEIEAMARERREVDIIPEVSQ
jgi:hypothetical protein